MFQIALVSSVFNHQAPMFQRTAHAQIKLIFFEWLENVVVGSRADGFESDCDVVHCCDHDHRNVGIVHSQLGEKLEPVHFRHDDVAQHQIERIVAESVERNAPVRTGEAVITLCLKKSGYNLSNRFFVIYYQDLFSIHEWAPKSNHYKAGHRGALASLPYF